MMLACVMVLASVVVLAHVMVLSLVMVLAFVMVLASVMSSSRGSHGLSVRRARRTKSKGLQGLQLEVGAPRLIRAPVGANK